MVLLSKETEPVVIMHVSGCVGVHAHVWTEIGAQGQGKIALSYKSTFLSPSVDWMRPTHVWGHLLVPVSCRRVPSQSSLGAMIGHIPEYCGLAMVTATVTLCTCSVSPSFW